MTHESISVTSDHPKGQWEHRRSRCTSDDCDDDVQIVNMSWFDTDNWRCRQSFQLCDSNTVLCMSVYRDFTEEEKNVRFFWQLQNSKDRDKKWEIMLKKFSTPQHFWLLKITVIRINLQGKLLYIPFIVSSGR